MSDSTETRLYAITEDAYWKYILKIEMDLDILTNLLFETEERPPFDTVALMCEYFALTAALEELLDYVDEPDLFDNKQKCFYVTEEIAARLALYLSTLVGLKKTLAQKGYSISVH